MQGFFAGKSALLWLLLSWALCSCGLAGDASGPRNIERRSEVVYEEEDGLQGAVRIDSLEWLPFLPFLGSGGLVEVEGVFAGIFVNAADEQVLIRYDLRFFDDEDFLIDAFIPFGQPVVLAAGERRLVQGEFLLRAEDARQASSLELMRLVAKVRHVAE
jgi:hypothetical protein